MIRRIRWAAAVLSAALLLCSCNVGKSANDLLSPPRLTAEQSAIYDALESAIGTDTFKLKYPRRGEFLSACILQDIDNDGTEEALVFYERSDGGSTATWMSVLVQTNGVWRSAYELPGDGSEIDLVSFKRVVGQDSDNIIVGWSTAGQENNYCIIYSFTGSRLEKLNKPTEHFTYSEMMVADVDSNGLDELILCTKNSASNAVMRLVQYRSGRIVRTSEVRMPTGMTGYQQLRFGPLTPGLNAIFADLMLGGKLMTTKIAVVEQSGITTTITELTEEELGIYESFDRPVPTLNCDDVNGDGFVDIPVSSPLPGYEGSSEGDKLYLTEYKSILEGSLTTVQRSVVNYAEGYQVKIPDGWADGAVTVRRQPDTGEWRFVRYNGSLTESTTELLRIKVVSPSVYQDKFETAVYRTLATKGVNEYMAHIPSEQYPGFSITENQLSEMFSLLKGVQ